MRKTILLITLLLNQFLSNSQTLGGYQLYGCLATAVNPNGCNSADYVTGYPDDSIWVNLDTYSVMTGTFSCWSVDHPGNDIMLETGYNTTIYQVKLLLSTGLYSDTVHLSVSNWYQLDTRTWANDFTDCSTSSATNPRFLTTIDYVAHFHISPTDTVVGISIKFYYSPGAPDFAGAYILSNVVGVPEQQGMEQVKVFPNPFTDVLTFAAGNYNMTEITLYDLTGKVVLKDVVTAASINTSFLEAGIYFYELKSKDKIVSRGKVIKG